MNSFFMLSWGRSGDSRVAIESVLAESWLASPMKERRSLRLAGGGKLEIASVIELSTW